MLQQYMNQNLTDVQTGFTKGRGTRDQIANISWIIEKATEFQKNIYFYFIDYAKAFDCVDHNKLEILKEMGIPDHLTCLLKNLYSGEEAAVRTRHGTMDWFKIVKGVHQGWASQVELEGKNLPRNAEVRDVGLIPGLGRSGKGQGNPLQYFCLENPHGQRSLVSYGPWGGKKLDTTKANLHCTCTALTLRLYIVTLLI